MIRLDMAAAMKHNAAARSMAYDWRNCALLHDPGVLVNKRLILDLGKYALAIGLLVWVVRSNWSPAPSPRAVASTAASTVAAATAPLSAAAALYPGRAQPTGLG
ncbi:MAG: hypothetical protein K2W96_23310, partial [Gemmataceae bacterium]|nr:hypothetical protein [Gemmataceae bacterium]